MEITIETVRVFVASGGNSQVWAWCRTCGEQAQMVTVDQAATAAGMNQAAVYYRIEAGEIHFSEAPEGRLLVCLDSLLKSI